MLQALHIMGFATSQQLSRLFFVDRANRQGQLRTLTGADRAAQRALRGLWLSRCVRRQPVLLSSMKSGQAYQHFVNVLTAQGARLLVDPHERAPLPRFRPVKISSQTISHGLAINDVYVLGYRATQARGMGWHDWLSDRQLTAMKARGSLKLVSIPDAFFVISHRDRYFGHFLEIDTGTESVMQSPRSVVSWEKKVADYGVYFREFYAKDGYFRGFTAPIVLTITSSQARLEHLLKATRRGGGAGVYWYTTADQINPLMIDESSGKVTGFDPGVLWHPTWRVANDRSFRSLSDRLNRTG
jgi:hypothetical protein